MPFIKLYVHIVWSTKNRIPFLKTRALRFAMWQHIQENAARKDIHIDHINGYSDHCHCLISLKPDQSLRKVVQLIKGESAFWINHNNLLSEVFEWQDEYYAVSVSESIIEKVREYLKNQEEYHRIKSFELEHQNFLKKFKLESYS